MSAEPSGGAKPRSTSWRKMGQGIKIFHEDQYPEVDILAVPGLGANPQECWTWKASEKGDNRGTKTSTSSASTDPMNLQYAEPARQFNWIRDPDGLASIFPKSRIMLYDYASAWYGDKKVRATMKGICTWLLDDLTEKRKDGTGITRPLIMIGHSMGGVVVAKTLCIARNRREFDAIVSCTVGCVFFGAPFRGTNMAKIALGISSMFGNEAFEALLHFMKSERNDALDEVTNDFMDISTKLAPPIDLFCAYETVPTDVAYSERLAQKLPRLLQLKAFKAGARVVVDLGSKTFKAGTHFVEMESAVLQGAHSAGLTADHRDLIKFESITSEKFGPIRSALTNMVRTAKTIARKRTLHSGQNLLTQNTVNQVRRSLEGVDMGLKFRTRERDRSISSWLTSEPLYQAWLTNATDSSQHRPYLWLKGGPGLGKTNASLAAIQGIGNGGSADQQTEGGMVGQGGNFLAYFLCEWTPGCCSAEDILKSLIIQIINQDESLAQHGARWFVPNPRYRGPSYAESSRPIEETGGSGAKATATVDNLWKCLQDMVDDPVVNSIHLIINNLHVLESEGSTTALLSKLRDHANSLKSQPTSLQKVVKWLITSRSDRHISEYLSARSISVIDLENDHEYGAKVKRARQDHAKYAISQLRKEKNYSTDLAYYVSNSIQSQSEDETWIDVLCILLRAMPSNSSNLTTRKWLKEAGSYNIHKLIDHAWETILSRNEDAKLEIEEIVQALTMAYEPPTLADLSVLTQIDDIQGLTELVRKCSPILQIGDSNEHQGQVIFTNPEFGKRLFVISHGQTELSNPQMRRYHGLLALRCFKYIKTWYKLTKAPARFANVAASLVRASSTKQRFSNENNLIDFDDDVEQDDMAVAQISSPDCSYPIKYLFRHLSEGFPDVAQELCEDDPDFWGRTSRLRNAWLKDFQVLTNDLKDLKTSGISALHVAAGIGAKELVSILVKRNGPSALSWTSNEGMTPLHVAAFNNHPGVVETLIREGADIEAGDGITGTALHLAALRGNCSIISSLIEKKANVNASSETIGPVINAAILSGTVDAVKQIMDEDVRFDLDYTKSDAPLSLSARLSEPSLFQDILETGREKWLQNAKLLDQALIEASYNGRLESVRILLKFPHVYTSNTLEKAILQAALERKWATVIELLDYVTKDAKNGTRREIKLEDPFYLAATSREDRIDVLDKIWTFTDHDITQEVRDFSLYQATVAKKDTTVVWLLDICGANANGLAEKPAFVDSETAIASSADFWTPLNAAASTGNISLVKSLLDKGATIDDGRGYALHLAASEGHTDVVRLLVERGADVNRFAASSEELGFFSSTALQVACEHNRIGVVDTLIKNGADPNLGGGALTNPISAATQMAQPDILMLLLEATNIDVNVVGGEDESTPLINAAMHMSTEAVNLLIQKGADVNARNAAGDTPLIMAAARGEKACVDLLCDNEADVTYRSPRRGLAIQVAAEGLHPLCAHTLAERMGGTIDDYRERGMSDLAAAKKRLKDHVAELKKRDSTIDTLNNRLAETEEQLGLAKKDAQFHQLEKDRLISMSSLQGETYESRGHQMKAIQSEREELRKELNASRGQVDLADATISRIQGLLEDERNTNAALRKRQGYVVLQEEKKAAMDLAEQEKQAAIETSKLEEQKRGQLMYDINVLQDEAHGLRGDLESARTNVQIAIAESSTERQQREMLQIENTTLHAKIRELEETLSTVEAAANKTRALASGPLSPSDDAPEVPQKPDYLLQRAVTSDGVTGLFGNGDSAVYPGRIFSRKAVGSPTGSPPVASPNEFNVVPGSPRQRPGSPYMNGRSPNEQGDGFRTIHGQHRPDGSLGGYPKNRMMKRTTSDSLYDVSVKNGSAGGQSMSSESLHSKDGAKPGSAAGA